MSTSSDSETRFDSVVENERPRTCEPTGTSSRSPVDRTCIWDGVQQQSLRTPSVAGMRETSSQAMQQLWDSVSRASALAERMMESVHRVGLRGASDDLHVIDTPVPRVSRYFNRGDSTPAGQLIVPELSCRNGTGALFNTVTVVDGRGVTSGAQRGAQAADMAQLAAQSAAEMAYVASMASSSVIN
jgi:hypothetical protein